jgi:hypothetical protein
MLKKLRAWLDARAYEDMTRRWDRMPPVVRRVGENPVHSRGCPIGRAEIEFADKRGGEAFHYYTRFMPCKCAEETKLRQYL